MTCRFNGVTAHARRMWAFVRMAGMRHRTQLSFVLALAGTVCVGGCVQRTITVTSEPTGALVHLNDEEVGRTPVTVPFTWYGTYDVRLERQGYAPLWTQAEAAAPWWEYPGPDLVAEAIPGVKSEVDWHFELEKRAAADAVDTDALIERADELREQTRGR